MRDDRVTTAIVAASRRELGAALKDTFIVRRRGSTYATAHRQGSPLLCVVTGVGNLRCLNSMEWLLSVHRPRKVISVGFAGALVPSLKAGELVLCQNMRLKTPGGSPATPEIEVDGRLLNQAKVTLFEAGVSWTPGNCLTVPGVVLRASEKAFLASEYAGASVVDMEGYWLARMCTERGVPFIAIRSVLDIAQEDLPSFVAPMTEAGEGKEGLLAVAYAITGPWKIPAMLRLANKARLAQRALSASIRALIAEVSSEPVRASTL